jgi:hypothetical protein
MDSLRHKISHLDSNFIWFYSQTKNIGMKKKNKKKQNIRKNDEIALCFTKFESQISEFGTMLSIEYRLELVYKSIYPLICLHVLDKDTFNWFMFIDANLEDTTCLTAQYYAGIVNNNNYYAKRPLSLPVLTTTV